MYINILLLDDLKISSIDTLLNILKLVPIKTPAIAALGMREKIGARKKTIRSKKIQ